MIQIFENQEVNKIVIDESIIESISWLNQFKDIRIKIDWCGQEDLKDVIDFNSVHSYLIFEFVTNFECNLKYNEDTMGGMEISSFSFKSIENQWVIEFRFDFYPVGYIKFICNDIKFIVEDK